MPLAPSITCGPTTRARRRLLLAQGTVAALVGFTQCTRAPAPSSTDDSPPALTPGNDSGAHSGLVSAPASPRNSPTESRAERGLAYVHVTLGGGAADQPLPWIVAFHGLGDTPEGFGGLFDGLALRAHVYLARAPLPHGNGYDWFGVRVVGAPELLALRIRERLPQVEELLVELAAQPHNVGGAVVTGFSQGGILSYAVAVAGLPHVRAALPIAGWLPPDLAATLPHLPVFAFHGEGDRVVPFDGAAQMVAQWHDRDATRVVWRTYPGLAHRISPALHSDWAAELERQLR